MKLRVLDLFSGIGGFSLGLERTGGFETVAFCEIEDFPRQVLTKHWPNVPIHRDVRELTGGDIGAIDVICGGYPCQPFSTAGKRRGKEDDRHLWPEFIRLVAELRPAWVIGENVAGHISMGLDDVLSDLEAQGYACRAFVIPACAVDAPHRRDRVWTVANSDSKRRSAMRGECSNTARQSNCRRDFGGGGIPDVERQVPDGGAREDTGLVAHAKKLQRDGCAEHWQQGQRQIPQSGKRSGAQPVAHADNARLQGWAKTRNAQEVWAGQDQQPERCPDLPRPAWRPEPDVGRVADGVPRRVDRLKALGNAVVPQIPEMIGRAILKAEATI